MSRRLRIVRVIPFHAPARRFGGVVTQAALTSASLAARGHRVTVLTTDLDVGPEVPRGVPVERDGYEVVYAPAARVWHREVPYVSPLSAAEFDSELRDADVMMMNVGLTLWNAKAATRARRAGVPYVYNAEGALCPTRLRERRRLAKALFVPLFERRVLRGAAALVAVTEQERGDYRRLGAADARIEVIPNGVVIPGPREGAAAFRARLGIGDAPVVLFLGRISPLKGIDLLLAAAARLREPFVLVVAGPDEGHRADLEQQAARRGIGDRVRFVGALHGEDKALALAGADLFALTSRTEGLPNAVLEAAAAGLPCLVSDACHVPEVGAWNAGAVVPCEVDAIAAALREMVVDPQLRALRGARARAMATEVFALERVVDRLEALLERVAVDSSHRV